MLIICAGLKRAASTLQYQLCREIISLDKEYIDYGYTRFERDIKKAYKNNDNNTYSIIKTHYYFEVYEEYDRYGNVKILSAFRDLRESSVSAMVAYNKSYDNMKSFFETYTILFYLFKSLIFTF